MIAWAITIAWTCVIATRAQGSGVRRAPVNAAPANAGAADTTQKKKASAEAKVHEITLPNETVSYRKSDLPGYQLTVQQCSSCHSPEYVVYQPRTSTRAYWQATVDKMAKVFGAPIPPDQIPPIVDYLARTYGTAAAAEAPKAP